MFGAISNWATIANEAPDLISPLGIGSAWVALLIMGVIHEMAHGLTCKRFGGEVREAGFLFIFFQPAFYTNVSDAWLFPRKWHIEFFLWGMASIVWSLTPAGSPAHGVALAILVASGVRIVFNFNPLIKRTAPLMIEKMKSEKVDAVFLIPV